MTIARHNEQFADLTNGTRLCYSVFGDEDKPAILLIAGLGLQLIYWPEVLIQLLTAGGYRVICFDNRDAGRSMRFSTPHPTLTQQLLGRAPDGGYTLEDMADDTAQLLAHLGAPDAHVVGMSMGGMIAQVLSARHPALVASMVSIFSTTGNRKVGQPALSTLWRMARAKAPQNVHEAIDNYTRMMMHIGDHRAPDAGTHWHDYARLAWQRNGSKADARALYRQIGAILGSGDRTASLQKIDVPALIIHGDVDHMVHPSGGKATAKAIPQARHVTLHGLRHQIDNTQARRIAPLILQHIAKGAAHVTG